MLRFLTIPAVMLLVSSPMVLFGRSLTEVFRIYSRQTDQYLSVSMNYPSAWSLLCRSSNELQYLTLKSAAILVTVLVLAGLMLWWFLASYSTGSGNLIIMAFLLAYTCVLFLPAMHERYSYLYEILAIILVVLFPGRSRYAPRWAASA